MKKIHALWGLLPAITLLACSGDSSSRDDESPALVDSQSLTGALPYRGVALSSAEFPIDPYGNGPLPGTPGTDYIWPDPHYAMGYNSAAYFVGKGMNTFRLPFRWERLQPTRKAAFNAAELARLTTTVDGMLAKGAVVLLDPHNYARYGTALIGSAAVPNADFADFWGRLAAMYKNNSKVVFGLMNEPHDMSTEQWVGAANAAITAIRAAGANNLILVPGNAWTGAYSWNDSWYGTSNASAMLQIKDPGNNYAFEVHQYMDNDASGSSGTCVSTTIGSQRLLAFTQWLKNNGKRGFLGEFAGGANATCISGIDDILKHLEANSDVWLGWTFWSAGPWCGSGCIEPINGQDEVRLKALLPHLTWGGGVGSGSGSTGSGSGTTTGSGSGSGSTGSGSGTTGAGGNTSTGSGSGTTGAGGSSSTCGGGGMCATGTYQAETMTHSVGGTTPGGWYLWSNGYVGTDHTFTAGPTHITVTAKGEVAVSVWPHMVVTVDGVKIGEATVSAVNWSPYSFPYTATAGVHQIKVAFDNDYAASGQDRNLLVDKVDITCN